MVTFLRKLQPQSDIPHCQLAVKYIFIIENNCRVLRSRMHIQSMGMTVKKSDNKCRQRHTQSGEKVCVRKRDGNTFKIMPACRVIYELLQTNMEMHHPKKGEEDGKICWRACFLFVCSPKKCQNEKK
jgi:hypothetical protein